MMDPENKNKSFLKWYIYFCIFLLAITVTTCDNNYSAIPPVTGIRIEPGLVVDVGEEVFFDATNGTYCPVIRSINYRWDFGDGCGVTSGFPYPQTDDGGLCCTHFYFTPGIFTVTLTVEDIYGNKDTCTKNITVKGSPRTRQLELLHADFHSRIAQYIYIRLGEPLDPGIPKLHSGEVIVILRGNNGYNKTMFHGFLYGDQVSKFLLRNVGLPAGKYELVARLYSGSTLVEEIIEKFNKSYSGFPRIGINEDNAICVDGNPFFPVTPWMLGPTIIPDWANKYINTLYPEGWYENHTKETWNDYCRIAYRYNMLAIGPERWDGKATVGSDQSFVRNSDINKLEDYVELTKDNPGLLFWMWDDEPNLGGVHYNVPPAILRAWTYKCHQIDPHHPVTTNLAGTGYLPYCNSTYNDNYNYMTSELFYGGRKTFPWDVIGMDIYPIDWQNRVHFENDPNRIFEQYSVAVDQMIFIKNYNLIPAMAFVEINTIDDLDTPPPTAEQLKMLIWLNIVHGVKAINWFFLGPSGPIPEELFPIMEEFVDQIKRLTPVVLGPETDWVVTDNANTLGNRVDVMVREGNKYVWIFAVRITELNETTPIDVTFTVQGISSGDIEVFDESRTVSLSGGTFTDTFDTGDVHIYKVEK